MNSFNIGFFSQFRQFPESWVGYKEVGKGKDARPSALPINFVNKATSCIWMFCLHLFNDWPKGGSWRGWLAQRLRSFTLKFMQTCVDPSSFFVVVLVVILGLHPQHMEVPRLGAESELLLPAYTTATATPDPSLVCDLYHSSQQHWILNPLSKAKDRTCNLMVPSQIHFHWAMTGTPIPAHFLLAAWHWAHY